jgi:hypothetical protein
MFYHSGQQIVITDYYLVMAKVREILTMNKQTSHRFYIERFSLNKLNEVGGKEQFRVEVSNRFAALEDLDAEVKINSAWERIIVSVAMWKHRTFDYETFRHGKVYYSNCISITNIV